MSNISQKTEKIASALYLLTSFFSDQEPLKWEIRVMSLDLASERVKDKFNIIREILSLLSIARMAGLVSESNYEIIAQELSKFGQSMESPLKLMFLEDRVPEEKALPRPEQLDRIKDKFVERMEKKELPKPAPRELKEFGAVSVKKNSRQSIIIGLLRRKKEIMIKDVSPLIEGCSEKTIQRELLAMVQAGILRKIGEKRWSRYTLA
ncbi:MAG: hypothetical protein UY47_C0008G0015 [Parcubacteria group bacterium GW2011_GWB1_49_7]|uniref:HTH deoR-type domain-containing protein n=1 Tax=Candidatus Zambryskibacteria bacterium RIFCSPHIGHO2_01_FULL_46_25 TaxID=1802738 RepID=A0A1G2T1A4_9BACT|nr:MAG: hypothetical protein UY47_C0008G0015 [Parcubacteria group bacterium GW2011_GWB1_49_7]OHA90798.1 MAG: hypothetical protein A2838_03295 [Candidatus Zambryskibacteria bacterium RIFCSPHIGHO2_01_FULL_46_25]OHB07135.1 MAG: hypothetical protein A3A31_00195 [Candidatus Zambryskibacteria bacterium RIFCSPLOWO2_01_FULL_48_25]